MKTVTCTNAKLEVVARPTPTPAKGQLLVDVLRCGICGSDLHARHHCDELADVTVTAPRHARVTLGPGSCPTTSLGQAFRPPLVESQYVAQLFVTFAPRPGYRSSTWRSSRVSGNGG
jgi:hypothetical protein